MHKKVLAVFIITLCVGIGFVVYKKNSLSIKTNDGGLINEPNPLSIEYMR